MFEQTAREALLSLAGEFDLNALQDQADNPEGHMAWTLAAGAARDKARLLSRPSSAGRSCAQAAAGAPSEPAPVSVDAGERSGDLSAATDDGRWWLEPLTSAPDGSHPGFRVNAVAFNTLTEIGGRDRRAWMPLSVRQECTRAIVAAIGPMIVAAERERIRQLAERNEAVCTSDEGMRCFFADLLVAEPGEQQ